MESIKEQVLNNCKHFTGIHINEKCEAGVKYGDVKVTSIKPHQYPCFKSGVMSGGKCDKCEFYTEEEADVKAKEISDRGKNLIGVFMEAKTHFNKTGQRSATIKCPKCGGELSYVVAEFNNHLSASCKGCGTNIRE